MSTTQHGVLEMAAQACFERAENYQSQMNALNFYCENDLERHEVLRLLQAEANACKAAIRALMEVS